MKKSIFLLFWCMGFIAIANAQNVKNEIIAKGQAPYLLGEITKNELLSKNYNSWFLKNYAGYIPDENIISEIQESLKEHQIVIFLGTWCGDSRLEVPRFYRVLHACGFPEEQLLVYALGRDGEMYKQSPNQYEQGLNIHRVPTFIFYKDGIEVNRIVEHPVESFEKDIQDILTVNTYQPLYRVVTKINGILETSGLNGLKSSVDSIFTEFRNDTIKMSELNTYSLVLRTTGKTEEAIEVLKLNTLFFPNDFLAHRSLGNMYLFAEDHKNALIAFKKALELNPENEELQKTVSELTE